MLELFNMFTDMKLLPFLCKFKITLNEITVIVIRDNLIRVIFNYDRRRKS